MNTKTPFTFLLLNGDQDMVTFTKVLDEMPQFPNTAVERVVSLRLAFNRIANRGISCFILTQHIFDMDLAKNLQKLLQTDTGMVVVVITGRVQKEAFNMAKQLTRIAIIEKPLSNGELQSVCEKALKGQRIFVREHKRFATTQTAFIVSVDTDKRCEGQICNISKGGIYFESESTDMNSGEVVKVIIPLKELNKSHTVFARIVWVVRQGYGRGRPGYGLQFMDMEDVTNLLLEQM